MVNGRRPAIVADDSRAVPVEKAQSCPRIVNSGVGRSIFSERFRCEPKAFAKLIPDPGQRNPCKVILRVSAADIGMNACKPYLLDTLRLDAFFAVDT